MQNYKARQTALLGMLFALSMALSFLESMLTPFFGLMPAMKLGLSNIVVMYAVLFLNRRSALYLMLLKALFALLTRGVTAGFLSLCGGALSLAVFCLLLALPFTITGYIFSVTPFGFSFRYRVFSARISKFISSALIQLKSCISLPMSESSRYSPFTYRTKPECPTPSADAATPQDDIT